MMSNEINQPLRSQSLDIRKRTRAWKLSTLILGIIVVGLTAVVLHDAFKKDDEEEDAPAAISSSDDEDHWIWCQDFDPDTAPMHEYLPCSNLDVVKEAYKTAFMQGIKNGSLDPVAYASYDLQDWSYLANAAALYGVVCDEHTCNKALKEFFKNESRSYGKLADGYVPLYTLVPESSVSDIVYTVNATKDYNTFENETSSANDARYTIVIMAPCMQLWTMLARQMQADGAPLKGNAYHQWIVENANYTPTGLNKILDAQEGDFDKATASEIYRQGAMHEVAMFNWATSKNNERNGGNKYGFSRKAILYPQNAV